MKFAHIADMHFDIPFTTLNKNDLGDLRRLEQRQIFKNIIDYIKQNEIEYLFICGDLYEHEYVKQTTIEYINNLFKEINETKIYIVPGNHDPIIKNSYYNKFNWNSNVHIFNQNLNKFSDNDVDIYGYGFNDFYMKVPKINELRIENPEKINIFLTHGTLDGSSKEEMSYNPIPKKKLKSLGFNYVGLGHIHMPNYEDETIVYPGSTISLGFDEQGKHGMIVGQIDENKKLEIAFIPVDKKEFVEKDIQLDDIYSKEDLVEIINSININQNQYYKINLVGERNFEINIYDIYKLINSKNIIKIKDNTRIKINIEEIASQNNLKGIFVKNMLKKLQTGEYEEDLILKAIEIGLDNM